MTIAASDVDLPLLRELALLLRDTQLGELEIARADCRLRLARQPAAGAPSPPSLPAASATPAGPVAGTAPAASISPPAPAKTCQVTAPLVGVAYLAPAPGEGPFVQVGDTVKEGQTLLVVEAMKTLNHITAPQDGRVAEVLVTDGQGVEFDQPLLVLD
ncbi:Biotin carboxyl carrier protein of acetyl-CoA carboxylase [plant metagenome]|uniref:Biotin carboxyl carrier protein of acetyl-CoA carboxylase n=1 Tax=plant metagenome TaxID=1297885 RepID=A0A484VEF0_9ZZZZ